MITRRDILKSGAGLAAILASGKAPAYLVKSMLAARNSIGMRAGGAKVPYDAEVEYLESTGTQYILLNELIVGARGMFFPADNNSFGCIGNWNGSSRCNGIKYTTTQSRGYTVTNGANSGQVYSGISDRTRLMYVSVNGTNVVIDDSSFTMGTTWANYTAGIWALFGCANWNTNAVSTMSCKIGWLELYTQAGLAHDFRPVRFTNEFGQSDGAMYDKISGELLGSGFLYGNDI